MATQPARELTARQQSALPGTGYHKVVRTAKWLRPTLAGVVGVAMLAWPVMGGHDFSFVLAKDRVAIASERLKIAQAVRSEEHTSELQSLMRISYAVFCLKKKKKTSRNSNYPKTQTTTKDNRQDNI